MNAHSDTCSGLVAAIQATRTRAEMARRLGISRAAVAQWRKVPAERLVEVERVTGISRAILRPDLFGPSDPPSGGSTFCPPGTSSPPVEPRFDGDNGEGLSSPSMVRISPTIVLDGLVKLGGPVPTSEPEDAA
jgi:hypothetical protein